MSKQGPISATGSRITQTKVPDVAGKIGMEASQIFDLGANIVIGVEDAYVRIPAAIAEQMRANAPLGKIASNSIQISGEHLQPMSEAARMKLIFLAGSGGNVARFYDFIGVASDLALASKLPSDGNK